MPEKVDKLRLSGLQDRRRKLTEAQKEKIRELYETGLTSQYKLADQFGVSRSLIGIIVNPKRAEQVKERTKSNWKDYSDREKLTEAVRNTRNYKKGLYKKGELK